jgi:hypothetical protein
VDRSIEAEIPEFSRTARLRDTTALAKIGCNRARSGKNFKLNAACAEAPERSYCC